MGEWREQPGRGSGEADGEAGGDAVARFLTDHPATEAVEFLISDSHGVLRGKWAPAAAIGKAFSDGVAFPSSMLGLDVWGREVMETGLHVDTGDRDGFARPAPATLRPVPWAERPTAQLLLAMHDEDGAPFFADPRHCLAGVVDRFARFGLRPCCALELEFSLLDPSAPAMPDGMTAPVYRGHGDVARQNMYAITDLAEHHRVFADIRAFGLAQGLPIDTMISEAAPGQFEVNLHHVDDALAAADDAVMLKRLVQETARRHGLKATFMPKPFMDVAGNGLHLHVSLLDAAGRNIFADPGTGETRLGAAIAGLLATMAEATLVFVPGWNGYRRLLPGAYAPTNASWGVNNRSVGVRVPAGPAAARRLEHRIAGADASPYLVTAFVLAGMLEGLERRLVPPPPVTRNAYDEPAAPLPATMAAAIERFAVSDFAARTMGTGYRDVFAQLKRQEMRAFEREITPLERLTYL
jgi:glutamine synthetase